MLLASLSNLRVQVGVLPQISSFTAVGLSYIAESTKRMVLGGATTLQLGHCARFIVILSALLSSSLP